ncbi:MAG: hypothetical protein WA126_16240 [Thermodesulfovibrionales bacterium]
MQYLAPSETDTDTKRSLLRGSCLGCHSKTDGTTWQDPITMAPIVYNSTEPSYNATKGLAAGNFYWVKTDDTKGHNVFLNEKDPALTAAPGKSGEENCSTKNCHKSLAEKSDAGVLAGTYGCQGCHVYPHHHADDSATVVGEAGGWYRFLAGHEPLPTYGHGVEGIEDKDWQYTYNASDHNEYLGDGSVSKITQVSLTNHTMTAFCCGCHRNFHIQDNTVSGQSPWFRHPSDALIPNSGEYASAFGASGGTGTYDPLVPVARPSLSGWTGPSGTVTLGTDLVTCLSCHRAHASPYCKMMRWDYKGWPGNGQTNGCNVCHTSKN